MLAQGSRSVVELSGKANHKTHVSTNISALMSGRGTSG
jgi:hypothetical protein